LQAVLKWHRASRERVGEFGLLLQFIDFSGMSVSNLEHVRLLAQSFGDGGAYLERQADDGLAVHARYHSEPWWSRTRWCLPYWLPGTGSCEQTFVQGRMVAGEELTGGTMDPLSACLNFCWCQDALYISDTGNRRVMRWKPGDTSGSVVAGAGAQVNGINELSDRFSLAVGPDGEIYVSDYEHDRILHVQSGGQGLPRQLGA